MSIDKTSDSKSIVPKDNTPMEVLFQEMSLGSSPKFTDKQIDQIIKQKAEVNKYIHDERMQSVQIYKLKNENRFRVLLTILTFFLIFAGGVAYLKAEYLGEVITGILGLLGGSGIGFGLGKLDSDKNIQE